MTFTYSPKSKKAIGLSCSGKPYPPSRDARTCTISWAAIFRKTLRTSSSTLDPCVQNFNLSDAIKIFVWPTT